MASVQSFSQALRQHSQQPRTDPSLLDIYLVLYDMLNDDDEELRDIAASAASWVLSYSSISPDAALALGPLNASELLSKFITEHYSDSVYFARRILKYLTGQEARISGSDDQSSLSPVSVLMAQYCQESTVLFVEEKQNLFIDEVREVDVWCRVLPQLKANSYPETLIRQVSSWVSEGLEYINQIVKQDPEGDGLLGWTSKPEVFSLSFRVISLAAALSGRQFSVPQALDVAPETLQGQLWKLLEAGRKASLHESLLSRIEVACELSSSAGQR